MGISIGNEVNTQNAVLNNLYSSVKGMTSQFLNTGTRDFADYLNKNFDSIDKNADKSISKAEIETQIKRAEIKNQELQKILDNKNLERMMAKLDSNEDEKISQAETNTHVFDMLKSSLREIQPQKDLGVSALNLAQNLAKNYYTNPAINTLATNVVSTMI